MAYPKTTMAYPKTIQEIFKIMIEKKASDLHLSPEEAPVLRLHGDMVRCDDLPPLTEENAKGLLYPLLTEEEKALFEKNMDIDLGVKVDGGGRMRLNMFQQQRGTSAVFRHINSTVPSMEELKVPKNVYTILKKHQGLFLVTGPTGSGKSTTLASLIDHINTHEDKHIITIEDPIEFRHKNKKSIISQRELGSHTKSFASALKAALREDPDIILVGELRDIETVRLAITAAETGHMVMASLHTQSAAKTMDRIIDIFPSEEKNTIRTMLSNLILGVISQRLFRTARGDGRVAAYEFMVGIPAIRNLIRENKVSQIDAAIQTGQQYGMQTLNQHIDLLVKNAQIAPLKNKAE